ncbi:MAG: lysine--tRNA ligase [Candidatus Hydrogenedens sp.]|nr:lysine--tRNA ligase [Candidatus Hydrogenedens sp.]
MAKVNAAAAEDAAPTEQDLLQNRVTKLGRIRERGDEPFKYAFERTHTIAQARAAFEASEKESAGEFEVEHSVSLAGRVTAIRDQGKSVWVDLRDEGGKVQSWFGRNELGEAAFEALRDLDLGDFLGVTGDLKRTKRGEITVFVSEYAILTKSLRPSVEKHTGLKDVETRYRQRYLDMVANPEVLTTFKRRIQVVSSMRNWLTAQGYLEVETPMLQPIPGGATARPFITHHNTYDTDLYLRIAPELYLKKLIVGGFDKVFEINRCFRNEGVDTRHNPEFTTMELYKAYDDYMGLMEETEAMLHDIIVETVGSEEFEYQGHTLSVKRPWPRYRLFDAIREYAGIDLEATRDRDEAARLAKSAGVPVDPTMGYGKIVDEVMSAKVQPQMIQPSFLYDYPIELSPLAKRHRDNPAMTERFQPFIACLEVGNAFSELNDPIDQRERFMEQIKLREAGDDEAQYLDEDFITALEVGMPPTAGLGIGIDRLAMIVTNSASIREVIFFPQLRKLDH